MTTDGRGRMRLDALEDELRKGDVGTVVATLGTTAIGAVDPLDEILALRKRYGFRVHVDAAYGGYFGLIADALDEPARRAYAAIGQADSIVIDPHKHGLQPYGCGCVLFRDPAWAASTSMIRRTRTSLRRNCILARSAWSARAPARLRWRCGPRSGFCRLCPEESLRADWSRGGRRRSNWIAGCASDERFVPLAAGKPELDIVVWAIARSHCRESG